MQLPNAHENQWELLPRWKVQYCRRHLQVELQVLQRLLYWQDATFNEQANEGST